MDLRELEEIAERELQRHGLHGWTFGLANTRRRLGVCKYRSRRIEVAEPHARSNPPEVVLDTLMHEIAHALAGPSARHGPAWKAVAVRLGASPRACDTSRETVPAPGDWQATCPSCQRTWHRYRRPRVLGGYRCRCEARSPLTFAFAGDPARRPVMPAAPAPSSAWEATCAGCATVHVRSRRPKAGVWRCKCPHRCELAWSFRAR